MKNFIVVRNFTSIKNYLPVAMKSLQNEKLNNQVK